MKTKIRRIARRTTYVVIALPDGTYALRVKRATLWGEAADGES